MTGSETALETFKSALGKDVSTGIACIQGLLCVLQQSRASTLQELVSLINEEKEKFGKTDCSVIAVTSATELFLRFITLAHTQLENQNFDTCLQLMTERGKNFLSKLEGARSKICGYFLPFVQEDSRILVHGKSKVVLHALVNAAKAGKKFQVYLTRSGDRLAKQLQAEDIWCQVVEDMAIGYIMQKVDCVLLGAEGVCESGGIVNQLGTLPTAIVANKANKPVYTLAESYKFVRFYPLGQDDLPLEYQYPATQIDRVKEGGDWLTPRVDYTPPSLLNLLFTDLGILTPSAVSDELINLYL